MNNAFIISLAYPETVVRMSTEWFGAVLQYIGIGKNNYVRAGHAAFVLIKKDSGNLEYFDFGRYMTPHSFGRVRSAKTDYEVDFNLKAKIVGDTIENLPEILKFLATNPQLTHGEGTMIASVCDNVNYENTHNAIKLFLDPIFVNYSVFKSNGSNCARFVTSVLMEGCNHLGIRKKLKKSTWFTPSTIGNVVLAAGNNTVFKVETNGNINHFNASIFKINISNFLDRLPNFKPNLIGNLEPKPVEGLAENAQWISGIGSGAWFEAHSIEGFDLYRFRRISPSGRVDVDGVYSIDQIGFNIRLDYAFLIASNCCEMKVSQGNVVFSFKYTMPYANFNSRQRVHTA